MDFSQEKVDWLSQCGKEITKELLYLEGRNLLFCPLNSFSASLENDKVSWAIYDPPFLYNKKCTLLSGYLIWQAKFMILSNILIWEQWILV